MADRLAAPWKVKSHHKSVIFSYSKTNSASESYTELLTETIIQYDQTAATRKLVVEMKFTSPQILSISILYNSTNGTP